MPTEAQQEWLNEVLPYAQIGHQDTGVLVSVILAQWADETAWGTSVAWLDGNNFAGVSPGGSIAGYPSRDAGLTAWVQTMKLPYYAAVRSAVGWNAQALALGESAWAAGHYQLPGQVEGSALVAIIGDETLWLYDGPAPAPAPAPLPKGLTMNGPVFDTAGRRHYGATVASGPSAGALLGFAETGVGTNQFEYIVISAPVNPAIAGDPGVVNLAPGTSLPPLS